MEHFKARCENSMAAAAGVIAALGAVALLGIIF